jgi:thiamine biosynthesis lipoprotein
VSEINRLAGGEPVLVDPELFELLELSVRLFQMTDGAFDVTSGPLTEIWTVARRDGQLPTPAQLQWALQLVGSGAVELDEHEQTVRLARPGVSLNFGGIGKGYALDRAAEVLENAGIHDFLFQGGRSSVIARGLCGGGEAGKLWSVGVIHPLRPERRLAEIFLRDRALSTSGSQTQSFTFQGRRYGHILDARTGMPADSVLSVTVLANTAAEADALSTALFVLGHDRGLEVCQQIDGVAALFVIPGETAGSIAIDAFNLNSEDWNLIES